MTSQDWYVRDGSAWRSVLGTYTPPPPTPPPDPDDPADPAISSWQDAWNTQDYSTILAWYNANAGLLNPSQLQPQTTGHVSSTHAGQVIENLNIRYSGGLTRAITVNHNNVTVRNCKIFADVDRNGIWVESGVAGTIVEHCEIDGSSKDYGTSRADGNRANIGVVTHSGNVTVRYNRIYGIRQGVRLNPDTLCEYNYIFGLHVNVGGVSTSSIRSLSQSTSYNGGTTVRRNLNESGTSGGITIYSQDVRPAQDVLWEQNLTVGVGRGFGILGGHSGEVRHLRRDIVIQDNRFHGVFGFPTALGEGTNAAVNIDQPGCTFDRNRWLGSSVNLPARCGTRQDACE